MLRLFGASAKYCEAIRRVQTAGDAWHWAIQEVACEQSRGMSAINDTRGAGDGNRQSGDARSESPPRERNQRRMPTHLCGVPYISTIDRYVQRLQCSRPGVPPTDDQLSGVVSQYGRVLPQGWPETQPDLVDQYVTQLSTGETRTAELRQVRADYQRQEGDTGSSEVQIAMLTKRISQLAEHMKEHRKDFSTRRGLEASLSRRRKLLMYLRRSNFPIYAALISRLGLRDNYQKLDQMTLLIQQRRTRGPSLKQAKKRGR